jgi:type I restriction enzyme S subunit
MMEAPADRMPDTSEVPSNSKWKRYPSYKESGIKWMGNIPTHWDSPALKRILKIPITDGPHETPEFLDEGIPFISAEAIKNKKIDFSKKRGFISREDHQKYSRKYCPKKGDIYLVKSGATTGNVAMVETEKVFNIWSPLAAIRPDSNMALTNFVFYFLQSAQFFQAIESGWSYGTQQNIGMGVIENIAVALPSLEEQRAIADFLDRETERIDTLIAKKERLIELLAEKRTALISHAVTKGLNPDAPMQDSGVPWLGQVPAHWEIIRSKWLFELRKTKAKPNDQQITVSQKYGPIYQEEFVKIEGRRVMKVIKGADILQHIEPNDFVISMRSFEGGIELCNYRGCVSSAYVVLIPSKLVHKDFFAYLFKSNQFIQALQSTTNLVRDGQAIRYGHFTLIDLPVIPLHEQAQIAAYLDRETQTINKLIHKSEEIINRLVEYRTALISAAVTGKIDVRSPST